MYSIPYTQYFRLKKKKTQRERKKNLFTMTLGGFMIVVRNKAF